MLFFAAASRGQRPPAHAPPSLVLASILALTARAGAQAFAEAPFTAAVTGQFSHRGPPAMRMPTDVAASPAGEVFVADGVNDRVLRFSPDGSLLGELTDIGGKRVSRPVGLTVDTAGRLWVADTGNARVVACSVQGAVDRVITPPGAEGEAAPDITDVAVSADGKLIWLVDNDHHRLVRMDAEGGTVTVAGRRGESLGELNHPFLLALRADGAAIVSDVINGRVAVFTSQGLPERNIAVYGVEPGHLYRPKGVAVDRDGNVWAADGTMGVVQVFAPNGSLVDVLRDASGEPMRFQAPAGICFDSTGALYVVEVTADRVRKLAVTAKKLRPPPAPPARPQVTGAQARGCTVCHIEWMEPFRNGTGTPLMNAPENPPDHPIVSRAETCLSCHDGSVEDSRRRVWQEHGHQTGMRPPETMKVPASLPLVEGKIACRTCHSAHAGGAITADMRTAVFLRVRNTASELCVSCHVDKTRGPQLGTHPTGGMPWPVPQTLIDAGARVGPNPRELTCQVCHTAHGAAYDHLLVMPTELNQLCLSCHDQIRPGMFRDGPHVEHPLEPVVSAAQAQAIRELGTRLGPGDRLICLSCHKLHHGKGERFMLAEDLTDGRFCLRCHSDKTTVVGSSHDLRKRFPDERNRLGMTPSSGGPCSACHLFHRYARAPETNEFDPAGQCVTCHQQGRCAQAAALGPVNHPKSACVDCHEPHHPHRPHYLRADDSALCIRCHQAQARLAAGPHDARRPADQARWPAAAVAENDLCMSCHRPHGDERTGLFRVTPVPTPDRADGACIACHPDSGWEEGSKHAALHPRNVPDGFEVGPAALIAASPDGGRSVACRSCHDPHHGSDVSAMLRVAPGAAPADVCASCHTQTSAIHLTIHRPERLESAGFHATACRPCHSVHATPAPIERKLLWAVDRPDAADPGTSSADPYCTGCHRPGGPARPPAVAHHPAVPTNNVFADVPGALPLFDADGRPDSRGRITCRTCHQPHGTPLDDAALATTATLSQPERRAMRLLLRPFTPPNICTGCHGADALRRFLYYHDPVRRGGPLTDPTAERVLRAAADGDK